MGHRENPDLHPKVDEDNGVREAREQCPSDHEVCGQIEQPWEGRGRGFDEWQNPANLGEKLHLQPRSLGPVPLGRLGQLFNRLWREAESTQLRESRL